MMRFLIFILLCAVGITARGETPHWIWKPGGEEWIPAQFSRQFRVDDAIQIATVKLAADFCAASVAINDDEILFVEPYSQAQECDVTTLIRRGSNDLRLSATKVDGPAAVALSLTIVHQDGHRSTIVSDKGFYCHDLGPVRPELWGIGRRPATISPLNNYEQWQQRLAGKSQRQTKLWAAPDFEVTLVRDAAENEGSWISLAFDPQGRATISREDQGLLRMTLSPDGRNVDRVEAIDVNLKECRGLLYAHGWLFANANNSLGMFRLVLTEDGKADHVYPVREFAGKVGHGRNDLALGPNGEIYSIHGDAVLPPGKPILDRTSPLRESRRGKQRQEGYLLKTDRDVESWEMLCTGLRNPYGIAVNRRGDLFTYDADNEYDMGTPWYRPTRLVQLVSGADYGYRAAEGRWPPEYPDHPDNGLPTIDIGRGSPTAVMFGRDLKFPPVYQESLFILDWTYGRVIAAHLTPHGAGYRAALELFLEGQPLNVTDLAAGPDGALYLITGGRKTHSALYRVAYVGKDLAPRENGRHEANVAGFSQDQRALRTKLETFHGRIDPAAVETAWPHLGDYDPAIRHAARIAIENQPLECWKSRALDPGAVGLWNTRKPEFSGSQKGPQIAIRAQLNAWMALARTGDAQLVTQFLPNLIELQSDGLSSSCEFEILHLFHLCQTAAPQAMTEHREKISARLNHLLQGNHHQLIYGPYGDGNEFRRRLTLLMSAVAEPAVATDRGVILLKSLVQEDRLQGLLALRTLANQLSASNRRLYFETLRDGAKFVGGQGMPAFLDRIKTEALATLNDAQRAEIADVLTPAVVADEPLPPQRPKVQAWNLDSLVDLADSAAANGDATRGATLFRDALCSRCHRAGIAGPAVGPDLTFVGRRFSRRDILNSILKPSSVVAETYRNVQIVTDSGKVYTGRLLNEGDFRSEKLRLAVDPLRPGQVVEIDKKEIEESRVVATSPMPEGLLDSFTRAEIADLLAFLERGASGP